jgi:integrase
MYALAMATAKRITLCWYAKVGNTWRYSPALIEKVHGMEQAQHVWVKDKGVLVECPQGRYVLRSYLNGKKVYQPLNTTGPRDAVLAVRRARRIAIGSGVTRNPLVFTKTAVEAYIKDCDSTQAFEAKAQAELVLTKFIALPMCRGLVRVSSIAKEHIFAYHEALRDRGMSPRTIFNKDARVRSWRKFCGVDLSFLPPKPTFEEQDTTIYTPGELKAILDAANAYMKIVINIALKVGLREQEIMFPEWADIDWLHATYRVQGKPHLNFTVKDKAQRTIPIPSDLLALLKEWKNPDRKQLSLSAQIRAGQRITYSVSSNDNK